jgi:ornithine cyclodeaminase/alanine dehydrogenase-like protein (mu-crystallin family)
VTEIVLDKPTLVDNIRTQFKNLDKLKYQRSLQEFFDGDAFIGDNVFETCFKIRAGLPPLAYEVSGPYCAASNEYATIGRIYERGELVFERNIKQQIQQRTAAMVWLFLSELGHTPKKILMVGAGKLSLEIVKYLKHFIPSLNEIDYHSRAQHLEAFETPCAQIGVATHYQGSLELSSYDTIIMATNTNVCLIDESDIEAMQPGAVIASLCTTSQTGEIAGSVYARDDVNVIFDYELTRSFTADMKAADKAGYLNNVSLLGDVLTDPEPQIHSQISSQKKNIWRITGTPMQNIAVLDMLRSL